MEEKETTSRPVRLLHEAGSCDPDVASLGLLLTVATRAAAGRALVLWFESISGLSQFLLEAFPALFCKEEEVEGLVELLAPLMPVLEAEGLTQPLLDELNEYTHNWATLEWLGTFEDLCAADTEVTQRVVAWFRADRRQDGEDPVTEEEREDLVEFLAGVNDL